MGARRPHPVYPTVLLACLAATVHLTLCANPPEMTVDPKAVTVSETGALSLSDLITFDCTTDTGTLPRVGIQKMLPTTPCGSCFSVLPCGASSSYCLSYTAGKGSLDAEVTPHYQLAVACVDGTPEQNSVIKTADVFIEPNTPPYFDPATYPDMHVSETISQSKPVDIKAVDDDGDPITYTMELRPPSPGIVIDSVSGVIRATRDLRYECRKSYSGAVYVKDKYHNNLVGPLAVSLDIAGTDSNIRPFITNLNGELHVREDEPEGAEVLSLAVFDDKDYPKDLEYTMTAFPASARHLFKIDDKDNKLLVGRPLDYENHTTDITLTVQVSDGYCESEVYTLTVKIVDINEPPILEPTSLIKELCEGKISINPQWRVTDPDIDDVVKFTKLEENRDGFFEIDENTGIVSTTIDYDLDVENHPSLVEHLVTVTDLQGATATATLTLRFRDCNDNAPYWTTAIGEQFLVTACDPVGTVAGVIESAKDLDSDFNQNNDIYYSGAGQGVRIEPSGAVVLTQQFKEGQVSTFQVYAHDQGKEPGPLTSKPYYVSVRAKPCIVVTVPPAPTVATVAPTYDSANADSFWDVNLGWVIPALLLLAALLALLTYMIWRYCYPACRDGACRDPYWCRKRPRSVTPVEPPGPTAPPERRPQEVRGSPGFIFGWWKETFSNEDYGKTFKEPKRDEAPEPSKGIEAVDTNTFDAAPPADPNALPPEFPPPSKNCIIL